jgi:hypothetical protein
MPAPSDPKRELPGQDLAEVQPNQPGTAPDSAIELARRAAGEWLEYRVNGDAPDSGVIGRALWKSVPAAAPSERLKGGARTGGLKVINAHPEDGGWLVIVATRDPRVAQVVLKVKRSGGHMAVTEIGG